jgi:hypothetical protein
VTLIVTRAKPRAYDNMARYLKQARSDVRLLYLSSHVVRLFTQNLTRARGTYVGHRYRIGT